MRIAHLSDIHFSDKYLNEVTRCADYALDVLEKNEPYLIVIGGDLFDHRLEQNSPALLHAVSWVSELADIAPTLILQGTFSHDAPHAIDIFRSVKSQWEIEVVDRIDQVLFTRGRFETEFSNDHEFTDRDVLFSCLPSINKGSVAAAVGAENAAQAVGENVAKLLSAWAPSHARARAGGAPSIVVTHGTVSGSLTEHGVPMAGLDHEYTVGTLFAADATAVMLGHIHKHQSWDNGMGHRIAYPGSLGRLHFGEYDPKGFLVWDIEPDTATFEFIETPARKLIDIEFENTPSMEQLEKLAAEASKDSHVRIRYVVDEEHRDSIDKDRIRALFDKCAATKIEARIAPVQRQRAAGIGQAASLRDKLAQWCELTNTEPEPLIERLAAIEAEGPDKAIEEYLS